MNQRPMNPHELVGKVAIAWRICEALDKAERMSKLGHAQRWRAAELVARHIIWQARRDKV